MADETHPVRAGAAETAPTAPHATPRPPGAPPTGPERFWGTRRVRIAFGICAVLSLAIHWFVSPFTVRSQVSLELRDTEGEIAIPIDVLSEEPPAPEAPPPAPVAAPDPAAAEGPSERDAAPPPKKKDAGAPDVEVAIRDAEPRDAEDAAFEDALPVAELSDAGAGVDEAGLVATMGEAGAIAAADAGAGGEPSGPRDPVGMVGALGDMHAGENLVTLLLNVEAIRAHPSGALFSKLVRAAPQWDDALKGTTVDPVHDADWVLIFGPSLIHTEKDVILVKYSVPDAVADEAIDAIKRRSHNGAGFDAGVPGVKATMAHADRAPRVILRGRSHVIAVVPPDYARTAAKLIWQSKVNAHVRPGEAMRMTLKNPSRPIPQLPARITELRIWIVPRADGGADVNAEGECADGPAAIDSAAEINAFLGKFRGSMEGALANVVTHGLVNALDISPDGKLVRLRAQATKEQVDAIISFVAAQLGIDITPQAPPGAPSSRP